LQFGSIEGLSGTIASEIAQLSTLTWINIGSNSITGTIPNSLGTLNLRGFYAGEVLRRLFVLAKLISHDRKESTFWHDSSRLSIDGAAGQIVSLRQQPLGRFPIDSWSVERLHSRGDRFGQLLRHCC
jgi:hypothetical protein